MMDRKITAKCTGLCNTAYTFLLFIFSFCQILFLTLPQPLGKKKNSKTLPPNLPSFKVKL